MKINTTIIKFKDFSITKISKLNKNIYFGNKIKI